METYCDESGQWWAYRNSGNRRRAVEKVCEREGCGTVYVVPENEYEKRRYCSRRCSASIATKARNDARLRRRGSEHPNWKGGRHVRKRDGYVQLRVDGQYVLEHRYVVAQHLGRNLHEHETVHHRNGDPGDNRLENLELRVGRHGRGASQPHCSTCSCFAA